VSSERIANELRAHRTLLHTVLPLLRTVSRGVVLQCGVADNQGAVTHARTHTVDYSLREWPVFASQTFRHGLAGVSEISLSNGPPAPLTQWVVPQLGAVKRFRLENRIFLRGPQSSSITKARRMRWTGRVAHTAKLQTHVTFWSRTILLKWGLYVRVMGREPHWTPEKCPYQTVR
jgi:hypothetical protein